MLLTGELHTTFGDVHGRRDIPTLVGVETELVRSCSVIFQLSGWNVAILDALEWLPGSGSLLVPDLEGLGLLLGFLALLLLGLSGDKDFLVVKFTERR